MKMTRSALKDIVKECLVEIISEGIGNTSSNNLQENRKLKKAKIAEENKRLEAHRKKLDTRIENTVTSLTSNPVMQEILADTAKTTLSEQLKHDRQPGMPSVDDPGINLGDIFSESSSVWAELAFSDKKRS